MTVKTKDRREAEVVGLDVPIYRASRLFDDARGYPDRETLLETTDREAALAMIGPDVIVERGRWVASNFYDTAVGTVADAEWEWDDGFYADAGGVEEVGGSDER